MPAASRPAADHVHDVVVVGARCAGAATARLLAARGHDVVVRRPGRAARATPCPPTASPAAASCSSPGGACSTRCSPAARPPVREVTFRSGGTTDHPARVKDRAGVDLLVAPRRHVLDALLADAAVGRRGHGAHRRPPSTACSADADGRVAGVSRPRRATARPAEFGARYVVGADGVGSRMARLVGARTSRRSRPTAPSSTPTSRGGLARLRVPRRAERASPGVFPTHDGAGLRLAVRPDRRSCDVRAAARRPAPRPGSTRWPRRRPRWPRGCAPGRVASPVRGCVAPPNHVRQAARAGLGAGRRRRLPPRPDHRPRHHRRLPGRRAARRRARRSPAASRPPSRRRSRRTSASATRASPRPSRLTRAAGRLPRPRAASSSSRSSSARPST